MIHTGAAADEENDSESKMPPRQAIRRPLAVVMIPDLATKC